MKKENFLFGNLYHREAAKLKITSNVEPWLGSSSSFKIASFLIIATRCANRQEAIDSEMFRGSSEMAVIIDVTELPPSESRKTDVKIEFRYGTWSRFFSLLPRLAKKPQGN